MRHSSEEEPAKEITAFDTLGEVLIFFFEKIMVIKVEHNVADVHRGQIIVTKKYDQEVRSDLFSGCEKFKRISLLFDTPQL